jgi:hypothetical protein
MVARLFILKPMMRKRMLPKLTKSYILDHVSQEEIFSAYFQVSLSDIEYCCRTNKLIDSTIRSGDERPSMGFIKRPDGKLKCRDFGGYFWGDCFDAAAYSLRNDITNGHQFMLTLEDIAKTFKIHKFENSNSRNAIIRTKFTSPDIKIKEPPVIETQFRDWNYEDGKYYYNRYYITREILDSRMVYPIQTLWVNHKIIYAYRKEDPAYGYYFGERDGRHEWKIYFPFRKEYRFITNCRTVQGIHGVKDAEIGVIIKSYKDVKQLDVFADEFDISSIAPISESVILTDIQMEYLRTKWKYIFTFSDFDYTGVKFACEMRRRYGTIPVYIILLTLKRKISLTIRRNFAMSKLMLL